MEKGTKLLAADADVIEVRSSDRARRWLVVSVSGALKPAHTLLLDRRTGQRRLLWLRTPAFDHDIIMTSHCCHIS